VYFSIVGHVTPLAGCEMAMTCSPLVTSNELLLSSCCQPSASGNLSTRSLMRVTWTPMGYDTSVGPCWDVITPFWGWRTRFRPPQRREIGQLKDTVGEAGVEARGGVFGRDRLLAKAGTARLMS
jgi:hypothetical protein